MNWQLWDIRVGKLGRMKFLALRVGWEFFFRLLLAISAVLMSHPEGPLPLFAFAIFLQYFFIYLVLLLEVRRLRDMGVSVYFCAISVFTFLLVLFLDSLSGTLNKQAPSLLGGTWVTEDLVGALFMPYFVYSMFLIFYEGGPAPEYEPRSEAPSTKPGVVQDNISSPDFKGRG